jgi:hypothetical protein
MTNEPGTVALVLADAATGRELAAVLGLPASLCSPALAAAPWLASR